MIDMLGVIFYEQRSVATKIGFIEVPFIQEFNKETYMPNGLGKLTQLESHNY